MQFTECPNLSKLERVLENPYVYPQDKPTYREYLDLLKRNHGQLTVQYRQNSYNGNYYGRYYADAKGVIPHSRQWRAVRSAICGDRETDIDIENCHPTILFDLCKRYKLPAPHLANYILDRAGYLSQLKLVPDNLEAYNQRTHSDWSLKDLGKTIITRVLYGSGLKSILADYGLSNNPFNKETDALRIEIKRNTKSLIALSEYSKLVQDITCVKPKAHPGVLLSFILQEEETRYVLEAIKTFQNKQIPVTCYIYDGFQVLSQDTIRINEILDEINERLPVRFLMKPFCTSLFDLEFNDEPEGEEESLQIPETEQFSAMDFMKISERKNGASTERELLTKKEYLENYLVFIRQMQAFCFINGREVQFMKVNALKQLLTNLRYYTSKVDLDFIPWWLARPDRREVERVEWIPYTIHRPLIESNVLNTFTQLKHKVVPDFKVNMDLVKPWIDHIRNIWADRDEQVGDYIENWFSHILQHPNQKTGVNIFVKSVLEGAGKNILTDHISKNVLGTNFTQQTSDLDIILGKFNAASERCLLTIMDEASQGGSAIKNRNRVKDLTTRVEKLIERKGIDSYMAPDYTNYIFTTNDNWISAPSISDRRGLYTEASVERVGDHDYFNGLLKIQTEESGLHLFHYFLQLDISSANLRNIPMTNWKRAMVDMCADPMFKTLLELKSETKVFATEIMSIHNGFCRNEKEKHHCVKSFNLIWKKYTGWDSSRIRIDETQKVGYKLIEGQVLETCRRLRKDPLFSFPILESEDDSIPDECLLNDN